MARNFAMALAANDSRGPRAFAPALVLLSVCALINYIDRGNLSVAAPLLKAEFGLSASRLGILLSAFFTTYTVMQFAAGWVADRFDVNRVLAAGFLVWSLATAITGVVSGFAMLLAMRLILGIGESVTFPSIAKIFACHLPEQRRGFACGVISLGFKCGNAVGTLGAGLLISQFGWRPVFTGIGLVSLLWLPAWKKWMPRGGAVQHSTEAGPGYMELFRHRSFWGTSAGHFCANYIFYFMLTWLPSYLVVERHLSTATMAKIASLFYVVDAASAFLSGWIQDFWIRRGYTATVVRKSAMAIGFSIAAIGVTGCGLAGPDGYLPWLLAAGVGCGAPAAGTFAFAQTLAGPQATGRWYGSQNGFGYVAGIVAPALTGFVLERTGSFAAPFAVTAAVCVAGALVWVFLVGRVEPVKWGERQPAMAPAGATS